MLLHAVAAEIAQLHDAALLGVDALRDVPYDGLDAALERLGDEEEAGGPIDPDARVVPAASDRGALRR
mgnify:CR=1 FL=1